MSASAHRPHCGALAACLLAATAAFAYPLDGYDDTGIRRLEGSRLANEGVVRDVKQPPGALLKLRDVDPRLLGQTFDLPPVDPAFNARSRGRAHRQHGRLRPGGARPVATRPSRAMPNTAPTTSRTWAASASWWWRWRCSRRWPTCTRTTSRRGARVLKTTRGHGRRLLAVGQPHGAHLRPGDAQAHAACGAHRRPGDAVRVAGLDAVAQLELGRRHGDARGDAAAPLRQGLSGARGARSSASSTTRRRPS